MGDQPSVGEKTIPVCNCHLGQLSVLSLWSR